MLNFSYLLKRKINLENLINEFKFVSDGSLKFDH